MLTLNVTDKEFFDEAKSEFISTQSMTIELEHSLVSLSKWESLWKKPFLNTEQKTNEETLSYIKAMLLTPGVSPEVVDYLSDQEMAKVNDYITDSMTATWFSVNPNAPKSREVITAELIYYWMVSFNIPFECQHWHLNRLFTLIKVCNEKSNPKKSKKSQTDLAAERRALNERRRQEFGTKG